MKGAHVGKGKNGPDISVWVPFRNRWHIQNNLIQNNLRQELFTDVWAGLKKSTEQR